MAQGLETGGNSRPPFCRKSTKSAHHFHVTHHNMTRCLFKPAEKQHVFHTGKWIFLTLTLCFVRIEQTKSGGRLLFASAYFLISCTNHQVGKDFFMYPVVFGSLCSLCPVMLLDAQLMWLCPAASSQ